MVNNKKRTYFNPEKEPRYYIKKVMESLKGLSVHDAKSVLQDVEKVIETETKI